MDKVPGIARLWGEMVQLQTHINCDTHSTLPKSLTTTLEMLPTHDMRAFRDPELGDDPITIAVTAVEAMVAVDLSVHVRHGGVADRAAEDNLL